MKFDPEDFQDCEGDKVPASSAAGGICNACPLAKGEMWVARDTRQDAPADTRRMITLHLRS
jgi:hypothetical protein